MSNSLSVVCNRVMYVLDRKEKAIGIINVVKESKSGNTVQADYGLVIRTNTKRYSIFHDKKIAQLELLNMDGGLHG